MKTPALPHGSLFTLLVSCVAWGPVCGSVRIVQGSEVDFVSQIEPILKRNCYRCHAGEIEEAGLLLDRADRLLGTADSDEPIVVPERAKTSLLLLRIADDDHGDLMPLDGNPLKADEIDLIRTWISQGASLPKDWSAGKHWAYETPVRPQIPTVTNDKQLATGNPIDHFIDSRLAKANLAMSDQADASTLARRVSLALTGLPASPEQARHLADNFSETSYAAFVDELLGTVEFGQHWARHWLDLARYADSNGFQADQIRDAWAYRDWVVDAFASDMPFDQFVTEQLAGDLLPDANSSTRIATGFHRTPTCNVEAGVDPEANRVQQVFDRVNTSATVFLGSTLECAQCHDHKYDPFSQADYYRFFAYFNNTPIEVEKVSGVTYDFVGPKMDLPMMGEQQVRASELRQELKRLTSQRIAALKKDDFEHWLKSTKAALKRGRAQWLTPRPTVTTTSNETAEVLEDNSVLFSGGLPGSAVYRFEYPQWNSDGTNPILGIRVDAMRDPSLPGGGPGRGDAERTNFVLHEIEASVQHEGQHEGMTTNIPLGTATASFSQAKFSVDQAIDGSSKTGWAVAPQFKKAHWAEFRTTAPVSLEPKETLVVALDQHFGRGRVIGRPKISFLLGPPETADLNDEIIELLQQPKPLQAKQLAKLKQHHESSNPTLANLKRKIDNVRSEIKKIQPPSTLVMIEQDEPRKTFVMQRGDYLSKGDEVEPGTPTSLHSLDKTLPPNRLGLARWITDPNNPLLARVTVNRFWMEIFGRGIVTTPEDFGTQADPPSHPDLLDWLAIEFQDNGWSIKKLLKTIVMSATFRQDSRISDRLLAQDPENVLLARGPRYRLPAETIRDNALAVAGLISVKPGGPPVMPYQPGGIWKAVGRGQPKWQAATDEDRYRRGLYVVWKRSAPYPSFVTFDAPDRASCTVRRPRTNTPLQALVLLNDEAYAEAAIALAARMINRSGSSSAESIATFGYELATGSKPTQHAVDILTKLYQEERERLQRTPSEVQLRLNRLPKPMQDSSLVPLEAASWFAVASVLLNLDATITLN